MQEKKATIRNIAPLLSLLLGGLVIVSSCRALFDPQFYQLETANWRAQSVGQDLIDLWIVVPVLLITSLFSRIDDRAWLLWGGTLLYLLYTFLIYCFDVHFNGLFLVYCLALGMSFYLSAGFILSLVSANIRHLHISDLKRKMTGYYFIGVAVIFYSLWLMDIIPSLANGKTPASLVEGGLPTNPVHVIDLSVFLPAVFITGLMVLKKKGPGLLLAPALLCFFILMDITIGGLVLVMRQRGIVASPVLTIAMGILALFSAVLLTWYLKDIKEKRTLTI